MFIPLFPAELHSHVVVASSSERWVGRSVPFCVKSVLVAYLRAGLVLGGIYLVVVGIDPVIEGGGSPRVRQVIAGLLCFIALIWTYKSILIGRASYGQACELADVIDLDDELKTIIGVYYGVASPEEASRIVSFNRPSSFS